MINTDLVMRKMALITEDLRSVSVIAAKSLTDYLASATDELVIERLLERMIGRMIDVNYHLITEAGQAPPRDYFDSFIQLGRAGVLDNDLAKRIAACAGLRNRIVHEYDEIDPERVYLALSSALSDIPDYLRRILEYIEKQAPPNHP